MLPRRLLRGRVGAPRHHYAHTVPARPVLRRRRGGIWHRRIGIIGAIFFVFMAFSGVALNHADQLGLDSIKLRSSWLLAWYGMDRMPRLLGNQVARQWVVWDGEQVYWKQEPVTRMADFLGATLWQSGLAVAGTTSVILLDAEGKVVDRLGDAELPGSIQAIGQSASGAIVLRIDAGLWQADADFVSLHAARGDQIRWVRPGRSVPPDLVRTIRARWQPAGVSLQRALLDVHSGRLLGHFGVWFVDLLALLLTALAGTGLYLWWKRR